MVKVADDGVMVAGEEREEMLVAAVVGVGRTARGAGEKAGRGWLRGLRSSAVAAGGCWGLGI